MIFPQFDHQYYDIIDPISSLTIKGSIMESIIGLRFNKWEVVSEAGRDKKSNRLVLSRCECGTEKIHRLGVLKKSISTQCKQCWMRKLNANSDLTGKQIGSSLVLKQIENARRQRQYLCRCECGVERPVLAWRLMANKSTKCPRCRAKRHGMTYTDTHKVWRDMLGRCTNKNHKSYRYYGARGISVCERWFTFENFLSDMGLRPAGLQIDRTNNDGNYEPNNCRWVTPKENTANRRNSKKKVGD